MSKTTRQPQQLAETPVHGVVWLDWEEWQTLQAFMGKADGSDTTVADLLGEIENRFFVKPHGISGRKPFIGKKHQAEALRLKSQGIPQRDVARQLGVSISTISLLVSGKYKFSGEE